MNISRSPYFPAALLFVIFLVITCFTYQDYGMAWDEIAQRNIGNISYDYVAHGDQAFRSYFDKEYGVAFEDLLIFIERKFRITDTRDIFLMRHLVSHIFFLLSAVCGYVLFYRLFKKRSLAVLGFLVIVLNPRLYAHSFFNTKDIPLLCAVLICLMMAQIAFERRKPLGFLLLGICCGFAEAIRPTAIMLPAAFFAFIILDIVFAAMRKERMWPVAANLFIFLCFFMLATYTFWPLLWHDPLKDFVGAYKTFSHFNRFDGSVLFMGERISCMSLPWTYVPVWFSITTPELWLVAGIGSIGYIAISFFRRPKKFLDNTIERNVLACVAFFLVPVFLVIVLHSTLYDDWRHLYFIYPAFVLLALFAIDKLLRTKLKPAIWGLCCIQLAGVIWFMVKDHPFQQVYFNRLVSHEPESLRNNYDLDYWGASYMQGLGYILDHDQSAQVPILYSMLPIGHNMNILPPDWRNRIRLIVPPGALPYYHLTNFRTPDVGINCPEIIYQIKVQNSTIMRVCKCY